MNKLNKEILGDGDLSIKNLNQKMRDKEVKDDLE